MKYLDNISGKANGVSRVGLKGFSERGKCKWLVRVGAVTGSPLWLKKSWPGGGGSGQPENHPGYATESWHDIIYMPYFK